MNNNATIAGYIVLVTLTCLCTQGAHAQNTILPQPIQHHQPMFWDTTLFVGTIDTWVNGHQWGTAHSRKLNDGLQMNLTNDAGFSYLSNEALESLYRLGKGVNGTNYIMWGFPFQGGSHSLVEKELDTRWYGMRWEPAENAGLGRDWAPRDDSAWALGFLARHYGSVPTSPSDVNYRRFKLETDSLLTYPVKVLDSVEPRNLLVIKRGINWFDPMTEDYSIRNAANQITGYHPDTTDLRVIQLVINLRRTDSLDVSLDSTKPVVSIIVPYQMRWKDQQIGNPLRKPSTFRMPFTRVPANNLDSIVVLPLGRGNELPMRAPGGFSDSIVITQAMLPLHSQAGGPDITVVAQFRTDFIYDHQNTRIGHILKNEAFNFAPKEITDAELLVYVDGKQPRLGEYNRRYMAIDSLGIRVHYHGNTNVAIRSASLLAPNTKHNTSGWHDTLWASSLSGHMSIVKSKFQEIEDSVNSFSPPRYSTPLDLKILGFYVSDEYDLTELLGMRYRLEFFDRKFTSETGYAGSVTNGSNFISEHGRQKMHSFPTQYLWNSGMGMPTRPDPVPYFSRVGHQEYNRDTDAVTTPTFGLKLGYRHAGWLPFPARNYEVAGATNLFDPRVEFALPLPDSLLDSTVYERIITRSSSSVGYMLIHEGNIYKHMYQTGDWYFSKRRYFWSQYFYHLDPRYKLTDTTTVFRARPYLTYDKFQPLTGEAVRLDHAMALNLGAKGFMYDKWYNDYNRAPSISVLSVADRDLLRTRQIHPTQDALIVSKTGVESKYNYFPGYVEPDTIVRKWDDSTHITVNDVVTSPRLGLDYFRPTDAIRTEGWVSIDTIASEMEVSKIIPGTPADNVYVGRKSVLMETRWWHDLAADETVSFKRGVDASNATLFMKTRPIAWYANGYKVLENGDVERLKKWVNAADSTVIMQRWNRASAADSTLVLEYEPDNEKLFDVVLIDTSEAGVTDDNCIIAVTNRRMSPFLFNNSLADSVQFISSYDFDTLTRGSRPDLRYKQVGARRITIPFNYTVDNSKPYLLHVRQLVPASDASFAADTIISGEKNLALDFLPGETKYLRVKRLNAQTEIAAGYLAFNTQNKMVAFPVYKPGFPSIIQTDSIRYHVAFHAPDNDTLGRTAWTVFYKRSVPYHRDSLPDVAGLTWEEQTIRVSKMTTLSVQNVSYADAADSVQFNERLQMPFVEKLDCSCSFPSILVRQDYGTLPVVHIVYSCEDQWTVSDKDKYFHVTENTFTDAATLNQSVIQESGKALVVGHRSGVGVSDSIGWMSRYGTPVINASKDGNFYAWSSDPNADSLIFNGIGYGYKGLQAPYFGKAGGTARLPVADIQYVKTDDPVTYDTLRGGRGLYPTLNVYSNKGHSHNHASLAWQEQGQIRYTRLYTDWVPGIPTLDQVNRTLPNFHRMSFAPVKPPAVPAAGAPQHVAVVSDYKNKVKAGLPVIVRSLQADTMRVFIRDTTPPNNINNLLKYNHEFIGWEEYVYDVATSALVRSQIRTKYFFDVDDASAHSGMHYWHTGTIYDDTLSLFHPVVTNAEFHIDSLVWQGIVDGDTVTYSDSLAILRGNITDSAVVLNYSVLPSTFYLQLDADRDTLMKRYWMGREYFSSLSSQQVFLRNYPGVPAPYMGPLLNEQYIKQRGAWQHLSARQSEMHPKGWQSVRRFSQFNSAATPSLFVSAEQLYKETINDYVENSATNDGTRVPTTMIGFEDRNGAVGVRAVLSGGRELTLRAGKHEERQAGEPSTNPGPELEDEYRGPQSMMDLQRSMQGLSAHLISEPFQVYDGKQIEVESIGDIRGDVDFVIEETDRLGYSSVAGRSAAMGLQTSSDEKKYEATKYDVYLSRGEGAYYRLRLTYKSNQDPVTSRWINIQPDSRTQETKQKALVTPHIVDLKNMTTATSGASSSLHIFPNPAGSSVSILVPNLSSAAHFADPRLDVVDAVGNPIVSVPVVSNQLVVLRDLNVGVYQARVTVQTTYGQIVICNGGFVVLGER